MINDDDFDEIFEKKNIKHKTNCIEYIMKYCRTRNYNFMLLMNDPSSLKTKYWKYSFLQFTIDPTSIE